MKSSIITLFSISLFAVTAYSVPTYAVESSTMPSVDNSQLMQTPEAKNKADGEAFLAANKNKPGVKSLPDGLQYLVLTEGTGPQPTDNDTVTVNYSGRLIDGTEFDSSYKNGKPMTFQLNNVIPGWVEALKLMKAGSKWEIYIPSTLAYGDVGAQPYIGPNQVLIFKVELLSVNKS